MKYTKREGIRHVGGNMDVRLVTNGIARTFTGKQFGNEFRVYRIHGDVSKPQELEEAFQELALKLGVEQIAYRPRLAR